VAILAGLGLPVPAIGETLGLAPGTVKRYLSQARKRLRCRTTDDLMIVLLLDKVIEPADLLDPRRHDPGPR
jgi:DNA-binding NarL/FixJ family response regulator